MPVRPPPGTVLIAAIVAWAAPARSQPTPPPPEVTAPATPAARPPPLHIEYLQYGAALAATINLSPGGTCDSNVKPAPPCILGSGGGLVIRAGYRSTGPWYFGGAYEFTKMDSGNLYRLGTFQQVRAEMRYLPDTGYRAAPFVTWGLGALAYGNEWGVETGGALVFGGGGVAVELSRLALVGIGFVYRPSLLAGWTDTAGIKRATGLAHFIGIELQLEVRSELGRR